MLKHCLALILLSVLIVMTMPHAHTALDYLLRAHDWIAEALKDVFAGGQTGSIIREVMALITIPLAVGGVPALILWLTRRRSMSAFMLMVWIVWLIQTSALVALFKVNGV